ncbi:hypothetical protein C2G38_2254551 [Gigaspora rosea]|uniref:Uncharacterized protein n=1 Tax=Gigaspora rosea TaxID=44941 RepID=A0A397UAK7_9GLOM|nr:hypothetical protein C2G38_2254551 [Gigaspora rosea]
MAELREKLSQYIGFEPEKIRIPITEEDRQLFQELIANQEEMTDIKRKMSTNNNTTFKTNNTPKTNDNTTFKTNDSNAPKTNDSNPENDQKKLSGVGIILDYCNYPGINPITFSKVIKPRGYYGF